MKNNKYLLLAISLVLLFGIGACEKDLDLAPADKISESTFFKEVNDFKLFANRFYSYLPGHGTWSSEDQGDLTAQVGGNGISNGSYQPSEYSGRWNINFDQIRNTSFLLTKLDEVDENLKEEAKVYAAEAYFFRAVSYYNLLTSYGGVPIITTVLDVDSEELYSPRASRIEVTKQIISDLDKAIAVLPKQSELNASDLGRLTKGAALAFKSRVALFEGTWQKFHNSNDAEDFLGMAIDAAEKVMDSGEYELWDKRDQLGDQSYRHLFILDKVQTNIGGLTKADNKEYILTNIFDIDLRGHNERPESAYGINPTKKFADLFLCSDGLPIDKSPLYKGKDMVQDEYTDRDVRMRTLFAIPLERYWSTAQAPWNRDWSKPDDPSTGLINNVEFGQRTVTGYVSIKFLAEIAGPLGFDWPVIRYAEVLLNYAEAVYEKNGKITDAELNLSLNELKTRVGLPALTESFATANGLNIREEIRRERAIELYKEGFRYNDLRRWKSAEDILPEALLGIKYIGTQFETDPLWAGLSGPFDSNGYLIVEDASKREFDPQKHYLQPLPRRELLLNENLEQNPGW
ncbi:MAG: RagB/SusD family nutrient uptake outer membrane protein [Carboxylicivirga sp.]|jgi:hypothetical protein|nr:RagB/SusD family nutrient uptake outer membrane protein [Carboxylicivirga sp.]MCT4644675.1 RagB/SusD family nutrient uptake outer membrane protein [Carboxylicivirga sp.]